MIIVRGADEAVIGNVHQLPEIQNTFLSGDDVIHKLLRRDAGIFGLGFNLLAVLVRSGQEHDVIAAQTLIACHGIGCNRAVGMADMQLGRGIVNGRCNIKFLFAGITHGSFLPSEIVFISFSAAGKSATETAFRPQRRTDRSKDPEHFRCVRERRAGSSHRTAPSASQKRSA